MKTIKRDKGIKGKPTPDINTCNEFYRIIRLRSYLGSINFVTTEIYFGKSFRKAFKYMKLDREYQLKNCNEDELEYRAQKIEVEEHKKHCIVKTWDIWTINKAEDIKNPEIKYLII